MYETIKTETLRFNQYTDSPGHHEVGIQPEPKGRGWSKDLNCFSLIFIKCLSPHVSVGKSRSSDCVTSKSEGTVEQETDRQICAVSAVMWIIHMERIQLRWFGYLTRWGVSKISKQEKILGQAQDAHKRTCLWERLCPPQELEVQLPCSVSSTQKMDGCVTLKKSMWFLMRLFSIKAKHKLLKSESVHSWYK